jgi:hypothetical protein
MKVLFDLLHEDFIDWGMKIVWTSSKKNRISI